MNEAKLTKTRFHGGVWEGLLVDDPEAEVAPLVEVTHNEEPLEDVALTPDPARTGSWHLRFSIPATLLSEGVQTFLIRDLRDDRQLGSFSVLTGLPLEDDLRQEVDLLRAELDMLKRAFRRHCVETG